MSAMVEGSPLLQGASRARGFGLSIPGLGRISRWWSAERPRAATHEADLLSVFDGDPDDGPENEGLMRYGK